MPWPTAPPGLPGALHVTPSSAPALRCGGCGKRLGMGRPLRQAEPSPTAWISPLSPSSPHTDPKLDPGVCRGPQAGRQKAKLAAVERTSLLRLWWPQDTTLRKQQTRNCGSGTLLIVGSSEVKSNASQDAPRCPGIAHNGTGGRR